MRWTEDDLKAIQEKRTPKPEKRPKYGNKKVEVNGMMFDSVKESRRYLDLLNWQMSGQITGLEHQKTFGLFVNGELICEYVADFVYQKDGQLVVEDTKSKATKKIPLYIVKKKLMKAIFGIVIREI